MTFADSLALMVSTLALPDLEATGVTYDVAVGDHHLDENANLAPPRIVIVPTGSLPKGAIQQGPKGTARVLLNEFSSFDALLLSVSATQTDNDDYAAVQTMRATFCAAMRFVFGSSFKMLESSYADTEGQSFRRYGRALRQRFTLETSLLDTGEAFATITSAIENLGISNTDTINISVP